MMHSEPMTLSPSSLSLTRSTPWVEGCCGPMLRMSSSAPRTVAWTFGKSVVRVPPTLLSALNAKVFPNPSGILRKDVVILAQGMALPLLGQENAFQVRVAGKGNPEHVEGLALEPVGRGPDARNARDHVPVRGV